MYDNLRLGRSSDLINRKDRYLYRFLEMLPGILAWATLIPTVVLSFFIPAAMAVFVIIFNTYWLIKTIYLSIYLRIGFNQVRSNMKIKWLPQLEALTHDEHETKNVRSWRDIYHFVVLPRFKESDEVVIGTIEGLKNSNYPNDRMIVLLTQEERAGHEENQRLAEKLQAIYSDTFFKFIVLEHPDGLAGELAGKGSNIAWAGKWVTENVINPLAIPYDHILVSAFDIDTIVMVDYFARLTYIFLTSKNAYRASYQPVPLYINNIWEAPAISRISSFSTSFWQAIKQEQQESMITYSSHSMPFTALIDAGFWQGNIVSEDSRIFWQCLLRYDGDYRVEPLYYPVAMDSNLAPTYTQTMVNIYKQHRRWGYGAENVPYFLYGFYKNKNMPFKTKFRFTYVMIEGIWSWATNPLLLFLLGWLPIIVGGVVFNSTVLAFNLPYMTRFMMGFAMIGLGTSVIFALSVLPPRPAHKGRISHFFMMTQWLLFPIRSIIFGAIPALDAQTRLMFGRYMGFWVTPKARISDKI